MIILLLIQVVFSSIKLNIYGAIADWHVHGESVNLDEWGNFDFIFLIQIMTIRSASLISYPSVGFCTFPPPRIRFLIQWLVYQLLPILVAVTWTCQVLTGCFSIQWGKVNNNRRPINGTTPQQQCPFLAPSGFLAPD